MKMYNSKVVLFKTYIWSLSTMVPSCYLNLTLDICRTQLFAKEFLIKYFFFVCHWSQSLSTCTAILYQPGIIYWTDCLFWHHHWAFHDGMPASAVIDIDWGEVNIGEENGVGKRLGLGLLIPPPPPSLCQLPTCLPPAHPCALSP